MLSCKSFSKYCYLTEEREVCTWSEINNMMMTVKCKKIKKTNYKVKDI